MLATLPGTSEIVEAVEELDSKSRKDGNAAYHFMVNPGQKYSVEDDINKLFEALDIQNSRHVAKDAFWKSAMKRPIRGGASPASDIGILEPVSLKQALRGLCISQASEMAAMKRMSKPSRLSGVSDAGSTKRLCKAVLVEASESGHPLKEGQGNVVISLVPESDQISTVETSNQGTCPSTRLEDASTGEAKMTKKPTVDEIVPLQTTINSEVSRGELGRGRHLSSAHSSVSTRSSKKLPMIDEVLPTSVEVLTEPVQQGIEQNGQLHFTAHPSVLDAGNKVVKPASSSTRISRPVFRIQKLVKKKINHDSTSVTTSSNQCNGGSRNDSGLNSSSMASCTPDSVLKSCSEEAEKSSPASSGTNISTEVSPTSVDSRVSKLDLPSNCYSRTRSVEVKADERSRSREKGDFSRSSKSSIDEYSSSTSYSEESNISGSSRSGYRPHMSKNLRWEAISCVQKHHKCLGLRQFKLLRKLGGGDIGTVYLAELIGTNCQFALKVMDNDFLASRRKMLRAQTEREILQMLDHPFLPTLFSHFTTDRFSCLVMEYCPGGDLHVLRQKQPSKSFSEQAARFYVAEVLLALEYLHMLGVVYRDLKPENVMVRDDGHIMLTDFDLSLRCAVNPTLVKSSSPVVESPKRVSSPCSESSCVDPFCLDPSWQVRCFTPKFLSVASKTRKLKSDLAAQVIPLPQLVVEPTNARSNSFVGTHEYLAPEIIKGEGHGSAVDWWTFGIFLYELLYGKTPFKGQENEHTLTNVVSQCLKFPARPVVSSDGRDLIRRLLVKEPENRLGSARGAAEIKQHPFFDGLMWALIRCAVPPELPKSCDLGSSIAPDAALQNKDSGKKDFEGTGGNIEFEMF